MTAEQQHTNGISSPASANATGLDPFAAQLGRANDGDAGWMDDTPVESNAFRMNDIPTEGEAGIGGHGACASELPDDYEEDELVDASYDDDDYVDEEASPDEGPDFIAPEDEPVLPDDDDPLAAWDDILHYDASGAEPDQLDYLEALAARLGSEGDEDEPEPIYREDIQQVRALCTRPYTRNCERCAQACPQGAISFNEEDLPVIADDLCTNCGICAGICDGFSSVRVTLEDLTHNALDIADTGLAITFACNDMVPLGQDPADNIVLVPCLAYVPPEAYAFLFAHGAQLNVCCDFDLCAQCQVAGSLAPELFGHAIDTAQAWAQKEIGFTDSVPTQQSIIASLMESAQADSDRRNMLSGLGQTMAEVATGEHRLHQSSSVDDFQERMERLRATGHIKQHEGQTLEEITADHRIPKYWPRRKLALEAAQENREIGQRIALWVSTTADSCTNNHACVVACPTGARQAEDGKLAYNKSYCIACGACAGACVNEACDFTEINASELLEEADGLF